MMVKLLHKEDLSVEGVETAQDEGKDHYIYMPEQNGSKPVYAELKNLQGRERMESYKAAFENSKTQMGKDACLRIDMIFCFRFSSFVQLCHVLFSSVLVLPLLFLKGNCL